METYEAVKAAAKSKGISLNKLSRELGKADSYIATAISRNSDPAAKNLAAMAAACGYTLALVPNGELPSDALVIDPRRVD